MSDKKEKKEEAKQEKAEAKVFAQLAQSKFSGRWLVLDDASGLLSVAGVEESKENAEAFAGRLASQRGVGHDPTPVGLYIVHVPQPEAVGPGPSSSRHAMESNEPVKPSEAVAQVAAQKVSDKQDKKDKS